MRNRCCEGVEWRSGYEDSYRLTHCKNFVGKRKDSPSRHAVHRRQEMSQDTDNLRSVVCNSRGFSWPE